VLSEIQLAEGSTGRKTANLRNKNLLQKGSGHFLKQRKKVPAETNSIF